MDRPTRTSGGAKAAPNRALFMDLRPPPSASPSHSSGPGFVKVSRLLPRVQLDPRNTAHASASASLSRLLRAGDHDRSVTVVCPVHALWVRHGVDVDASRLGLAADLDLRDHRRIVEPFFKDGVRPVRDVEGELPEKHR